MTRQISDYVSKLNATNAAFQVNLMLHFKVSTSRDFRINNAALQGILENPGNDSDYGSDGDGDDVSRRSGTNSVTTANDNDDDGDVEEEIASMVKSDDEDEVDDGSSDVGRGDVEDCEVILICLTN